MQIVLRILGLGAVVFLLYSLFSENDSTAFTTTLMIVGAMSFVLYFITLKISKNEKKTG